MSLIPRKSALLAPQTTTPVNEPAHKRFEQLYAGLPGVRRSGAGARVLLINSGHLGDVILGLSAMKRVPQTLPNAECVLMTLEPAASLIRATGWFSQVWSMPDLAGYGIYPLRYAGWFKAFFAACAFEPHLSLSFMADPEDQIVQACAGGPLRIGPIKDHNWVYQRGWLTHPLRVAHLPVARAARTHAIADLAGMKPAEEQASVVSRAHFAPPKDHLESAASLLQKGKRNVALLMCGSNPRRRWPIQHYAEMAEALSARGDCNVLLISGPSEKDLLAGIEKRIIGPGFATHVRKPLLTLLALLQGCDLALTVDSGPGHLAAASGVRTIYMLPEHKLASFLPPGEHVTPVSAKKVARVSPLDVKRALFEALDG